MRLESAPACDSLLFSSLRGPLLGAVAREGCRRRGRSEDPRRRIDRERAPTLQEEGSARGHHQGHQEALNYLKPGDKRRAKQALARKRNRKKLRRAGIERAARSRAHEVATHGVPRQVPGVCGLRKRVRVDSRRADVLRRQAVQERAQAVQSLQAKRATRASSGNSGPGGRVETRATCSACGKETTVPFRPTQGRPVFCKDCFQQRKSAGLGG